MNAEKIRNALKDSSFAKFYTEEQIENLAKLYENFDEATLNIALEQIQASEEDLQKRLKIINTQEGSKAAEKLSSVMYEIQQEKRKELQAKEDKDRHGEASVLSQIENQLKTL